MFKQPLSEKEVISATKSAQTVFEDQNKDYKYKNETLINLLEISDEEQKEMKIIISREEYRRRKNIRDREYQKENYDSQKAKLEYKNKLKSQGKLSEKEKISQRRAKIKDLLTKGLKRKDICSILNISIKTYKRDIKFVKEQGLI